MLLHIKSYLYLAGRRCARLVCLSATNSLHGVVREREHTIQLLGFTPHVGPTWPPYTTSTKYILYLDFLTAFSIFILSFVSQELPSTVEVIYRSSPKVHLCSPEKRRGRRERGRHACFIFSSYLPVNCRASAARGDTSSGVSPVFSQLFVDPWLSLKKSNFLPSLLDNL